MMIPALAASLPSRSICAVPDTGAADGCRRTTVVGNLANEVHIWKSSLDLSPEALEQAIAVLAEDEIERARRYKFARDRRRFVAARAFLRRTLAGYVSATPRELIFAYGRSGKPELPPVSNGETVAFNLSHAGDLALLAVTRDRRVGVDVEYIDELPDLHAVASRFFSARENAALNEFPANSRVVGFYRCWTRKEAFLKALGDGLAHPLDAFDVSLDMAAPRLLRVRDDPDAGTHWQLYHLDPEQGYLGAMALEGGRAAVVWR
jgi:4'-phosphopantetheinyl transferase